MYVVQTALNLAYTKGIDAISTRRIAAALSVSAMALYGYIERKEDVLDLMNNKWVPMCKSRSSPVDAIRAWHRP